MSASRRPRTDQAVRALRAEILTGQEGSFLGSERELIERFGISRPTLRQAVSILEQEQLLEVRSGPGGGYFGCRPSLGTVVGSAARYAIATGADLDPVVTAWVPLRVEAARLASRNCNACVRRDKLELFFQQLQDDADKAPGRKFLSIVRQFNSLLTEMADNIFLSLFIEILHEAGEALVGDGDVYSHRPERIPVYRNQMIRLAQAVLEGDEQLAVLTALRCADLNMKWISEDKEAT